jgi:HD-like signal output (HDOD) protein
MFSFRKDKALAKTESDAVKRATILELKKFKPLRDMGKKQLVLLEAKNNITKYRGSQQILERGTSNNIEYFLLAGSIRKIAHDGKEKIIQANTPEAINPISHLQPRQFDVYAHPECTLIEIAWDVIAKFFKQTLAESSSQPVYINLDSPTLQKDLVKRFADDVKKGKFNLPSIPEVAHKVSQLIDDPTSSSAEIAKVIAMDPSIAVKVVSTANSPMFRGVNQVKSCEEAVTRLGFKTTKQLVQLFAIRELFSAKNPRIRKRFSSHWALSRKISAIGYVLAKCVHGVDENEALLGGIIQNIGVLPALVYIDSIPGLAECEQFNIDAFINKTKNVMGAYMLKAWGWPMNFVQIAAHAEDWRYQPESDCLNMVDILIIAEAHLNIIQKFLVRCPPLPNMGS